MRHSIVSSPMSRDVSVPDMMIRSGSSNAILQIFKRISIGNSRNQVNVSSLQQRRFEMSYWPGLLLDIFD